MVLCLDPPNPFVEQDAEDVVRKLDNDGDGLVTKEELLAAYTGFGQAARHEAIAAAQQLIHGGVDEAAAAAGVSFPDLDMSRLTGTRTSSRPTGELELVIRRISADLGLSAQVTRRLTAETALRSRRLTGGRTTTRQEPQQEVGGAAAGGQAGQLSQAEEEALEALQYVPASWVEDEVARGLNMFR